MTVTANAGAAGGAYVVYLFFGIGAMAAPAASRGIFDAVTALCALTLGVTLYALTGSVDRDLAMIAMACRLLEAAPGNGEFYFAVGSTIFCWLLLRGALIPAALAWIGVVSSAFLVALKVMHLTMGTTTDWSSPVTWFVWLPTLIFELTFAVWLLTKGVGPIRNRDLTDAASAAVRRQAGA